MKKINILLSAALMFFGLTAKAQTTITFDTEDYAGISVYDKWEESPFRTGELTGNAGVVLNPSTTPDEVLGIAPNSTEKVVGFQRSRYASNAYGVRIDLKKPIRVTKNLQYIHVMTYLKDKPANSRMMVMGLGKRIEASWSGQKNDEVEQFWALTPANVQPKDGWQDIVVSFKGFSYSKEENENSGIDIYALVIVPDLRTPDEDDADWVAYFDEIVVDNNPDKRFSTEQYALTYDQEATISRTDRALNKVGLTSGGKTYESAARSKKFYSNHTASSVFSAKAGAEVQPTFGYSGNWMSGYVYVDWGKDALFNSDLNANGTPAADSDVVSYSAVQIGNAWYKSDGTTRGDGNAISAGVPKFTVPAGTAPGFYRMRYKVDWNSINPAGATDIITNGGGIVDITLDVHGDEVAVNASQLNGDIVVAADKTDLINYVTGYEQPLKVKIVPAPGFVQYGFTLKYGYNVAAKEQLDDKGNPNWIEVKVPYSEIAADSTYTIPAEYMRGSQVSIEGDMQQVQQYTVAVVGLEGRGGAVYANIETLSGGTINATQYFTADQISAIAIEGYTAEVTLNDRLITVTYTLSAAPCQQITSLSELKNYKLYQIKSKNNEGYFAWNTNITDQYLSLRGVTNFGSGEPSASVRAQYTEEVNPYDVNVTWHILKEGNSYYLYHPARKAYVTRNGRDYQFTETKTALDIIRDNGDGTFSFHAGGSYSDGSTNFACIVTNENQIAVRNWTWNDHGSVMQIIENPNVHTIEYTVEVVGGIANGGFTFEGTDYAHGAIVQSTAFLTGADVTARPVEGYDAEVTVDAAARTIRVAYSVDEDAPVVVTSILENKLYTLECRSANAHNTTRFIGITGDGKISGQSAEAAFIKFEKANQQNGYYIKIVDANKYLNHNGSNISASTEKSTVWTLGVPTHTANVVTFTIGNDKYLNNNGSDCADNTCTNLKANSHAGGPGSGNACSLWEMTQYPEPEDETPVVVTAINNNKAYTLECRSGYAHSTERFIGVTADGKINGNSSTAAYIQFEPANTANGYYIKVVAANKYLNHNGSNISASAEKSTVWTLGVPTHTAGVVTFTIGNDKYLNNNGSDCADNTCTNLKANPHAGGPGATNACSLWEMTEYSAKVLEPTEPEDREEPDEEAKHTSAAKDMNIYFNPCGVAGSNYITIAKVHGEGAPDPVVYKATAKPSSWHVPYPHDYGQVVRGGTFDIDFTLSANAAADLKANAYFDWDANGVFETTVPITLTGADGTASVTVPGDAASEPMRMRVRINSNGLDFSEDDVMGFVYDFHISVIEPQQGFTASASTSATNRGTATLSSNADSYEAGAELTATATAANGATFVCWKEEGVIVSTDAQYTFTIDHNVNLKAYFTPAIDYDVRMDYVVGKAESIQAGDKVGEYSQAAVSALANDIAAAKAVSNPTQADIDALQAAINGISVNMPSPAKLYKIVKPGAANSVAYAGVTNSCSWGENTTPASVWVFEKGSADNKFYLRNLSTGSYTTSYNRDATVVLGEKNQEVTIVYHGANRQMGIAPNGGQQLNRANNRLCAWTDDPGLNSNSAWIIEEVEDIAHSLTVSDAGWATLMLGFNAVIPEEVESYVVGGVEGEYVILTEVNGVLAANTPVVVKAESGEYQFSYTTETATEITDPTMDYLKGTLYNKYISGEAYVLGLGDSEVGFYKAVLNMNAQGNAGTTHFLNNANKAYLVLPQASNVSFYSFIFGEGTTAIDDIVTNETDSTLIYDLAGRRVEKAGKGIYIVNGKKLLIK